MAQKVLGFVHELPYKQFCNAYTNLSKTLIENPKDYVAKQSFAHLLTNYKAYHNQYNKEPAVLSCVSFWSKKVNLDDKKIWEIIDSQVPLLLDSFNNKSLCSLAYGIADRQEIKKLFVDHVINNIDKFSGRELADIVRSIPAPELLNKMVNENKILVSCGLDILFYLKSFSEMRAFTFLEEKFCELMPTINDLQLLMGILHEFTKRNYFIQINTLALVEQKIMEPNNGFNLKDMNHILKIFNHSSIYDKPTPAFWDCLEQKIEKNVHKWPIAITMNYLAKNRFFRSSLFEKLIPIWKAEVDRYRERLVFKEGFASLALTEYLTEEIME